MAEEGKGVALAILGIVAVIAVVGLVLLFSGSTGGFVGGYGSPKVYPGKVFQGETGQGFPYSGEGAYMAEQVGDCLSNEFWTQNPLANGCRPSEVRTEILYSNGKFPGAPDPMVVTEGYCCLQPNVRAPYGE